MFKAEVFVTLKTDVLDPQGKAVKESLFTLGYDEIKEVRIGKFIELLIDSNDKNVALERTKEMCEKLLANTVIEEYQIKIDGVTE